MSDTTDLNVRHSYHITEENKNTGSNLYSKSDINVALSSSSRIFQNIRDLVNYDQSRGEYYKRYEHDEVPVKDSNINDRKMPVEKCLTDLELDKLETRIFSNVSQELQTDECSLSSLESNIKFFKTTVEKIFDNFYNSMRDFELYKRRFHEILARSKEGSIDDMEEFIKDMFEHIMSTDNSSSNLTESDKNREARISCTSTNTYTENDSNTLGVMEAYKNDNYLTDSTFDDKSGKQNLNIDDIFNVFLLDGNPCVEIKLKGRNLLSEINLKQAKDKVAINCIASADNMRKIAVKKSELEKYGNKDYDVPDREIPVKVSYAKKNIHLDEDFAQNTESTETSFLSKICNMLCKKFRRTTLG